MTDVARRAGVALGTVSNVLNYPHKVAPTTVERVRSAIDELGFVRNSNARDLAGGRSATIGLSVIDISNSLFVDIARGAQAAVADTSMNVMIANSDNSFEHQDSSLTFFDESRVAGILLAPMEDSGASISRVRRHGRPVVVINYDDGLNDCCTVLVNNEQVGYLAARHLIDVGRTRLAFVGGRDHLQPVHQRRLGARRAVAETAGRVSLEEISTETLDPPDGIKVALELTSRLPTERPDGVIAVTDLLGMAIIQAFNGAGVDVPGDVAVMGCDHNSAAWGGTIPLSSVQLHGMQMGTESMRLLIQEIEESSDVHVHETVILAPELVVRESTVGRA